MSATSFAILDLGTPELLVILAIVVLLFGAKKLPELSKSIGESLKELRSSMSPGDSTPASGRNQNNNQPQR